MTTSTNVSASYHVTKTSKLSLTLSSVFHAFAGLYQMEMMRHLRHVNVDHLHVGWYQSTYFGSFINKVLLHSQYEYQHTIEESVVLVYGSCSFCVGFMFIINLIIGAFTMRNRFSDPLKTAKGHLSLKALRLTPTIMDLYRDQDFTPDRCVECVHCSD